MKKLFIPLHILKEILAYGIKRKWWTQKKQNFETYDLVRLHNDKGIKIPISFLNKYKKYLNWNYVCHLPLTEKFIEQNIEDIYWYKISKHSKLSESFMNTFWFRLEHSSIALYQTLSQEFIKQRLGDLSIEKVARCQVLTLDTIENVIIPELSSSVKGERYKSQVWHSISKFQKVDINFIEKHIDNIKFNALLVNKNIKLSLEFVNKHKDKFPENSFCLMAAPKFRKTIKKAPYPNRK